MLSYFSGIRLRHSLSQKYLYSLAKRYPSPPSRSRQQIVVAVSEPNDSTLWLIKPKHGSDEANTVRDIIKNGDTIRLLHKETKKNLHSHPISNNKSPITKQQEVSCYGHMGIGNIDDNWQIELIEGPDFRVGTKIIIKHSSTGAVLHSHEGHSHKDHTAGEQEVTCTNRSDDNDIWEITEIDIAPDRTIEPLISFSAEGRFGPVNFYSLDEAATWINNEDTHWSWLTTEQGTQNLLVTKNQYFTSLKQSLKEATTNIDSDEAKRFIDNLQTSLTSIFRDSNWPISQEPIADFIKKLINKSGPKVAASALACLMHRDITPGREIIEGAFAAFAYKNGISGISESEISTFRNAQQEVANTLAATENERQAMNNRGTQAITNFISSAKNTVNTITTDGDSIITEYSEKLKSKVASWEQSQDAAEKRVKDFEDTLRSKIAVEESVSYWNAKGQKNFILAALFTLAGGAFASWIYIFLSDMAFTLLNVEKIGIHDYWRIAILVFTVTIAIWAGRLLVQLIFSNLHQWSDARERQTMIQTYLALKKDGYLPEGKDVSLILGVLFRPSDSGLLKGERGPATPAELIVRQFDRTNNPQE